ncbi:MAG: GNAT family N-acetyltransferase [bacterium]|nr:GNAT family N-acetyltransferase [bacterium]
MNRTITTVRLELRRPRPGDAAAMYSYRSLPEVVCFQCWEPVSAAEVQEFLEGLPDVAPAPAGQWFQLGIYERESGTMVGDLGLRTRASVEDQYEVGITVSPVCQGRGYGAEALTAGLGFAFEQLAAHRVYGSCDPRNTASLALQKKVGMRFEAHLVEAYPFKGGWADDVIHAMLAREWAARS